MAFESNVVDSDVFRMGPITGLGRQEGLLNVTLPGICPIESTVTAPVSAGFFAGVRTGVLNSFISVQNGVNNAWLNTANSIHNGWLNTVTRVHNVGSFAVENPVSVAVVNKVTELSSVEGLLKIGVAGVAVSKGVEWVKDSVQAVRAVKESYRVANKVATLKATAKAFGQFAAGAATISAAVALVVS